MEDKSLLAYSDERLRALIGSMAERTVFSYNDYYAEIQRREQAKNTEAIIKLTRWTIILTVVATLATVISTIATLVVIFK